MKSVSLSQVVRSNESYRALGPVQSWRDTLSLALTLVIGLTLIAALFMAYDPSTPVAFILVPVLVGGMVPVFAALPAKFEVFTRFHAHHFIKTLDETILAMGYKPAESPIECTRVYCRKPTLLHMQGNPIAITVHEHAILVGGPFATLRMLQQKLAA